MCKQLFYSLLIVFCFCIQITGQETEIRHDGVIVPNLTATEISGINSPEEGHTVYNSDTKTLSYFDGLLWKLICPSPFVKDGSLIRQKTGFATDDFIFGKEALPTNGELVTETFFFFDENNGAMRGGRLFNSDAWEPSKIGTFSFAWGNKVEASGDLSSVALGQEAKATGTTGAISIGDNTLAAGDHGSAALGYKTEALALYGSIALGDQSVSNGERGSVSIGKENQTEGNNGAAAIGAYLIANANSGTVVGRWNDPLVAAKEPYSPNTPIFMVGNGTSDAARSNAMTVLANGDTDIVGNAEINKNLLVNKDITSRDDITLYSFPTRNEINLNFDLDQSGGIGTGFGNIRWSDQDGGEFAKIEGFSNQGGSAIPEYLSIQAGVGGSEENHLTLWEGSASLGPNKFQTGGSARLIVAHDSQIEDPQIRIVELDDNLFGRIQYTNSGSTHNFAMSARPANTNPRWQVAYDGEEILTVHGDDIQDGGSYGRVGINDLVPTYALELPNRPEANIGCARAFSWETYSDGRVKKDVSTIENALAKTMTLNPVQYKHHDSEFENGELIIEDMYDEKMGFIAQELNQVFPNAVFIPEDEDEDYWSINYTTIIPVLTKAIQEQQLMIEELQETVASMAQANNLSLASKQ